MGGYNSLCEVLKWQKKALVVPRPGPSTEQRTRAQLFADRGLVAMLDASELSPERMAEELARLSHDDMIPHVGNMPPLDGAQRAASLLVEEVSEFEHEVAGQLLKESSGAHDLGSIEAITRLASGTS
jgi:predicted glycosyltransferase